MLCCIQVRRLICACLVQLYLVGDTLPLYSRVASLQSYLGSKVRYALIILALSLSSFHDMRLWPWLSSLHKSYWLTSHKTCDPLLLLQQSWKPR